MSSMWSGVRSNIWSICISEVSLSMRERGAAIIEHHMHHCDIGLDGCYIGNCYSVLFTSAYLSSELLSPPIQRCNGVALVGYQP